MTRCESEDCRSTATYLLRFEGGTGRYCPDCTDFLRSSRNAEVRRLGGI